MDNVVDEFRKIVAAVSAEMLPQLQAYDPLISAVHYEHGHPIEVINKMGAKDKLPTERFNKYPLIALFEDFPEKDGVVSLHLIIARATKPTYDAPKRYELNFNPVLTPVFDSLMKQISYSTFFKEYSERTIERQKINRVSWGKEGLFGSQGNIFNDYIDCIEVRDLSLRLAEPTCTLSKKLKF